MELYEFLSICSNKNVKIKIYQDIPYESRIMLFDGYVSDAETFILDKNIDECIISEWQLDGEEIVLIV